MSMIKYANSNSVHKSQKQKKKCKTGQSNQKNSNPPYHPVKEGMNVNEKIERKLSMLKEWREQDFKETQYQVERVYMRTFLRSQNYGFFVDSAGRSIYFHWKDFKCGDDGNNYTWLIRYIENFKIYMNVMYYKGKNSYLKVMFLDYEFLGRLAQALRSIDITPEQSSGPKQRGPSAIQLGPGPQSNESMSVSMNLGTSHYGPSMQYQQQYQQQQYQNLSNRPIFNPQQQERERYSTDKEFNNTHSVLSGHIQTQNFYFLPKHIHCQNF